MNENNEEYEKFIDKFKRKKTTDDCYTPEPVYNAVRDWVVDKFDLSGYKIIRPFYPDTEYKNFDYSGKTVVIDNPPFSIISEICSFFEENNVKYFIFAPHLTLFSTNRGQSRYTVVGVQITYENGAKVNTSFVNNLQEPKIMTAPDLRKKLKEVQKPSESRSKYSYPINVISAANMHRVYDINFAIGDNECRFIRKLDCMGGKTIYGAGFLISERAAAERAAAERAAADSTEYFDLSQREKDIIAGLGK